MEKLLSFFGDLILFTAGVATIFIWIVIIAIISIEAWDAIFGTPEEDDDEEDF